jgi:dihydroneopterin aldolase
MVNTKQEIVGSSFETLEALADNVVRGLRDDYFKSDPQYNDVFIRVRVEKPLAVPFADAPSIEIVRPIRTGPRTGRMVHE